MPVWDWDTTLTVVTVVMMVAALIRNLAGPDVILLTGVTLLMTVGALTDARLPEPAEFVAGFGNEGLITVAVLFVLAAGLSQTGAMSMLAEPLLGHPRTVFGAQSRLMLPVAGLSAFLNNTPIVAMFIPVVTDWCKRTGISSSKLLIPLSYAAILCGGCTLIGTSTNLVVYGMTREAVSKGTLPPIEIGMFTITVIGIPVALAGMTYILIASRWLLPQRKADLIREAEARRYTIEMLVKNGSGVDGKSIEQAGLRHLAGLYLAEIDREGDRIVAPGPEFTLRGNDRLIFVGVVDSVVDLQRIRGLVPATGQVFKLEDPRPNRCLVEAVVSNECPLVGKSIREGHFRTRYNAVVIAVHRGGQHLGDQKIGDIVMHPGDTLLMETHPRFVNQYRNSHDFLLVSAVADSQPRRHEKAWIAMLILAGMVIVVTPGWLSMLNGALIASGLMVATRCCSGNEARRSIDWRLLLVIGSAFGIGEALNTSGAAPNIANALIHLAGNEPWIVLAVLFFVTTLFTEMITNNAAAVLVFPIAQQAATTMNVNFTGFAIAIMIAASASFATPIGYQTNLMVYGAGGYRYSDYLRFGSPINLIAMIVTVLLVPVFFPFR